MSSGMELSAAQVAQVKMLSRAKTLKGTSAKAKARGKGKGAGEEEGEAGGAKGTEELPSVMRAMFGANAVSSHGPGPGPCPGPGPGPGPGPVRKNKGAHGKSPSKAPRPRADPRTQYSKPAKPHSSPSSLSAVSSSGRGGDDEGEGDAIDNTFMAGVLEDMLLHSKDAKGWTDEDDEHMAEHIAFVGAMNGHRMLSSAGVSGSGAGGVRLPPKPPLSLPLSSPSSSSSSPAGRATATARGNGRAMAYMVRQNRHGLQHGTGTGATPPSAGRQRNSTFSTSATPIAPSGTARAKLTKNEFSGSRRV